MPYKNKKDEKQRNERYYRENKEKHKVRNRDYYRHHKKESRERGRRNYWKAKAKVIKLLGSCCVLCASEENVLYHEIYGRDHYKSPWYILKHIEDFIPICVNCHNAIHHLSKIEVNEKKLLKLLQTLKVTGTRG